VAADLSRIVPNRPVASVYIDAVGPLPRGGRYQYILVVIDHFTRYAEVKAVGAAWAVGVQERESVRGGAVDGGE